MVWGYIHQGRGKVLVTEAPKNKWSSLPMQPSTANRAFGAPSLSMLEILLSWSCAGNHRCCELMCATAMACQKTAFQSSPFYLLALHTSPLYFCDVYYALGAYILSTHSWYFVSTLWSVMSIYIKQYSLKKEFLWLSLRTVQIKKYKHKY